MSGVLARARITVNCIIPGFIGGARPFDMQKEKAPDLIDEIPMGHWGKFRMLPMQSIFLSLIPQKYVTGQVLEVGGGIE